ncbi:hypothetical protein RHMOL_Rhmol06G0252400 [Rhododendron molle]|uniref:Uncharacterized protein n=1 Tax=Rhododendron molle TaxID=49168 RepID=A0ACC0NI38_RHOML|nr:hypothetical protein RHMOL_Rhmol06G0252400 [Rhododendron molle]
MLGGGLLYSGAGGKGYGWFWTDGRVRGLGGAVVAHGRHRCVLKGSLCEGIVVRRLLVDGAWDKKSWKGAIAWCSIGDVAGVRNEGRKEIFASSALMAEALAVWYALTWAFDQGSLAVEICSDCLVLVQGFQKEDRVHPLVRPILSDIVPLACKFDYVIVSKVPRTEVRAAHALAKNVKFQA